MSRWASLLVAGWFLLGVSDLSAQFDSARPDVLRGRELFLHEWQPNDPRSLGGDGLGPLFNANSCVGCHRLGGVGGAGGPEARVDILAVLHEDEDRGRRSTKEFLTTLEEIHPDFVAGNDTFVLGVPLHRFSTTPRYEKLHAYLTRPLVDGQLSEVQRKRLFRANGLDHLDHMNLKLVSRAKGIQLALTHRSTPALFGLELVDRQISDEDIEAIAKRQEDDRKSGISGRQLGKFGWRGQINSLEEFVKGACANELGLQVDTVPQGTDPLRADYELDGNDLTAQQVKDMVTFVRSLPRPQQIIPEGPEEELVAAGRMDFARIGCAKCHVETVGNVEGVYSDFLLHDMGSAFEDPVPAEPPIPKLIPKQIPTGRTEQVKVSSPYFGGVRVVTQEIMKIKMVKEEIGNEHFSEWKTPPLWGVADSAPYMHDGRAATLREAIQCHGGEAEASARKFAELTVTDQENLLKFLGTLRAPRIAETPPFPTTDEVAATPDFDIKLAERLLSSIPAAMPVPNDP